MNEKPKTVHDMPKPDQVKAKDTGASMIEPKGPVGKGSLESMKMDQSFSPSATPKAVAGVAQGKTEPPKGSGGMTAT